MNTLSTTLPASKARSNFYQMIDEAANLGRQFMITLRGQQKAAIVPAEELESWQETLDVVSNSKLLKNIQTGLQQFKDEKGVDEKTTNKLIGW